MFKILVIISIVAVSVKFFGFADQYSYLQATVPALIGLLFDVSGKLYISWRVKEFKKALEAGDMKTIMEDELFKKWFMHIIENKKD